jgi:predicted RNase H-like nuclease (RuvC/YqgF family)
MIVKDLTMTKYALEKWAKASIEATQLKFALENLLTKNFSPEEKQSKKYYQLLEVVDNYIDHVIGDYRKEKQDKELETLRQENEKLKKELQDNLEDNKKLKKQQNWWSLRTTTIAGIGAIITLIIKTIIGIVQLFIGA